VDSIDFWAARVRALEQRVEAARQAALKTHPSPSFFAFFKCARRPGAPSATPRAPHLRRKGQRGHDVRRCHTHRHQGWLTPARRMFSRGLQRSEPRLFKVCARHPGVSAQVPEGCGDRVRRQHSPRGRPRVPCDGGAWAGGGAPPPRRSFPMPSWCGANEELCAQVLLVYSRFTLGVCGRAVGGGLAQVT